MFELKKLSANAVATAQEKAVRYRLLNEPRLAESICRDILGVDPANRDATVTLILALSDQFGMEGTASSSAEAMELVPQLTDEFDRHYYSGVICERRACAQFQVLSPSSGHIAYDWFRQAMDHFDLAEALSPEGNDLALLRWNTCARVINAREDVCPAPEDSTLTLLE